MKPRTPEELANPRGKEKISLYLDIRLISQVKTRANKAGTSTSKIVNEAIVFYLRALKEG
jgi:hypothetical protein